MALRNLNDLVVEARTRYADNYNNRELKLHQNFKNAFKNVLDYKGNTIRYLEYSAEITINQSNNKIFLPNQWFCISTFLTDYTKEILNYKNKLIQIKETSSSSPSEFWNLVKNQKGNAPNEITEPLNTYLNDYFDTDIVSLEHMKRFLTDYSWWNGQKSIDRPDFYVSPILNILGVVNVAQTYIATIVYFYATNDLLMNESIKLLDEIETDSFIEEVTDGGINLIVYGAPGTGKSRHVEDTYTNITRVVFHPEYTYYDFVGAYKPNPIYRSCNESLKTLGGDDFVHGEPLIDYSFVPGPFISVIMKCLRTPSEMHTLLIEEINRANASSVFGDMFQLLDRKANGLSEYTINLSKELKDYLSSQEDISNYFTNGLFIPPNMNIIATMNSADQGVFVLDSAFKRRWHFKYNPILKQGFTHQDVLVKYGHREIKWKHLLQAINEKLKDNKIEEDRLIGPYFITPEEILSASSIASKLLIYLWDDVFRHNRDSFFDTNIRTYSELTELFYDGADVINILEYVDAIITNEQQQNAQQEEDEQELSLLTEN